MASWDRRDKRALDKARDAAVREQVRNVAAFSSFWHERFRALAVKPADISGVQDLGTLPAVGERDVAPTADPAAMAGLVLQSSEAGYMLHGPGPAVRRALSARLFGRDVYRRLLDSETRPTSYLSAGLGFSWPVASTRSDLDVVARAGARLWEVLGLSSSDALVSAVPVGRTVEHVALEYAALAAGAPGLFPGPELEAVAATIGLAPPTVLAAPSAVAADLVDDLVTAGTNLSSLRALLLMGAPTPAERRAAAQTVTAAASADVRVLGVHAADGARLLWGECSPGSGYHSYPDLEVLQLVDPETGDDTPTAAGEVVLTQLGMRGSALLRWRTGDLVTGWAAGSAGQTAAAIEEGPCPACGRRVPRLSADLRRRAMVPHIGTAGRAVDARSVAAALVGRGDVTDWRIAIAPRQRDGRTQVLVHVVPAGDPAEVAVGVAHDIRSTAGFLPSQIVLSDPQSLPVADGTALTPRILVRP